MRKTINSHSTDVHSIDLVKNKQKISNLTVCERNELLEYDKSLTFSYEYIHC
jgi:hypothetical protein